VTATLPVRFPDVRSPEGMTRRAWWLVGLNVVIPGSAQILAGDKRLGRFGLAATLLFWVLLLVAGIAVALARGVVFTLATNPIALIVAQVLLVAYVVLWVILTIDTLRLVRFVRTRPSARLFIAGLAAVSLALVAGTAGYGAVVANSAYGLLAGTFQYGEIEDPVDGRYNFLLLGGDAGPDRQGLRPDSISVVSVDAETGAAVIIGIPRNLENVPFPADSSLAETYPAGYGVNGCDVDVCLINSIYTEVELHSPDRYPDAAANGSSPGIEAMRDAAEGVTGLTIQYYVLIDMQGFGQLIDALGGVTITVPEATEIGINGDDAVGLIEAGEQRMDGPTALWYARTRYQTTDYERMERQRLVQESILAQFEPATLLTKFQSVAEAGAQVVRTDIPSGMLGYFVDLASKTRALPVVTVELAPSNGIDPEDPYYPDISALIANGIAQASPTPAPE